MTAELLLGIAAGGGVAVASGFVGHVLGFTRGVAQRNVTSLFVTGSADSLYCTCGHAMSFHDKRSGPCNYSDPLDTKMIIGVKPSEAFAIEQSLQCRCLNFTGDPQRNPSATAPSGTLDLG